ncbi:MAG: GPO family capsid scaffolding protein, partial [Desulfotignum sp.]|nr:GPO family capsid scaffolding protein [Desulfotignum sp.]
MPATLVTDWKRVAQSGPTVDGRNIEPQWLLDMAETYDPNVYTAKLWLDHMRYASYGSVRALKAEKDGDIVRLFARISPSRSLLQMNQVWEEYLHFSIEPTENFAETGKCYLTGLGMTDMPASLGTEEMRFAKVEGRQFTARYPGEQVPDLRDMDDDNQMDHFGRKLARWLFRLL